MKLSSTVTALFAALTLSCTACASPSLQHTSNASEQATLALAHGSGSAVKGAASVAAVPLLVVGSAGLAVGSAGSALVEFASQPLPLGHTHETDKTNTTPDPSVVIRPESKQ